MVAAVGKTWAAACLNCGISSLVVVFSRRHLLIWFLSCRLARLKEVWRHVKRFPAQPLLPRLCCSVGRSHLPPSTPSPRSDRILRGLLGKLDATSSARVLSGACSPIRGNWVSETFALLKTALLQGVARRGGCGTEDRCRPFANFIAIYIPHPHASHLAYPLYTRIYVYSLLWLVSRSRLPRTRTSCLPTPLRDRQITPVRFPPAFGRILRSRPSRTPLHTYCYRKSPITSRQTDIQPLNNVRSLFSSRSPCDESANSCFQRDPERPTFFLLLSFFFPVADGFFFVSFLA